MFGWAERALADGRIAHLGFSFHDEYSVFEELVDATDLWEFCQIQYNFMDEDYQAGTRGLEYATARGLGVIAMEPVRGGQLARRPPEAVAAIWAAADERRAAAGRPPRTPVDWALQWVWNRPEVSFLLSGMSTMAQLEENLESADRSQAEAFDDDDLETCRRVRDAYLKLSPVPCTDCHYCLPCPSGVNIPKVLDIYNEARSTAAAPRRRASPTGGFARMSAPRYARSATPARSSARRRSPSSIGSRKSSSTWPSASRWALG